MTLLPKITEFSEGKKHSKELKYTVRKELIKGFRVEQRMKIYIRVQRRLHRGVWHLNSIFKDNIGISFGDAVNRVMLAHVTSPINVRKTCSFQNLHEFYSKLLSPPLSQQWIILLLQISSSNSFCRPIFISWWGHVFPTTVTAGSRRNKKEQEGWSNVSALLCDMKQNHGEGLVERGVHEPPQEFLIQQIWQEPKELTFYQVLC